jgi:lipopolysaccharide transport system permease protein
MPTKNPLKNIYIHRDLLLQFTRREIELRHKGSRLGHLWAILSPLLMLGLYLFIFGVIFGGHFGVLLNENFFDFAIALFLGISLFQIVGDTIAISPTLIINQPNFVKKVVFPLEIISLSQVLASFYYAFFSITICIISSVFSHGGLSTGSFSLPLLLLPLAMTALGISWGLSAIGVFIRDLNHITSFISNALMYASAIVYSISRVPVNIRFIIKLNPLAIIVNETRNILLWKHSINTGDIIYVYIVSTFILVLGYTLFKRLRPYFAELL